MSKNNCNVRIFVGGSTLDLYVLAELKKLILENLEKVR